MTHFGQCILIMFIAFSPTLCSHFHTDDTFSSMPLVLLIAFEATKSTRFRSTASATRSCRTVRHTVRCLWVEAEHSRQPSTTV